MNDYGMSRSQWIELIDEWIFNERDRNILKRRMLDGIRFEQLAEEFNLSVRQVKTIVYKQSEKLFKHALKQHFDNIVKVLFILDNLSMKYIEYNPNPIGRKVGDCAVRAISKALKIDWETAYLMIAMNGLQMGDMPSSDSVWGSVLRQNGFYKRVIPNTCPECYTVRDFCMDNPTGVFLLAAGDHVVAVIDGDYYDAWDSGSEVPLYFWRRDPRIQRGVI